MLTQAMKIHLERLPRLALPIAVAFLVGAVLMQEFELSRMWAVPAGLWCGLQVQNYFNRQEKLKQDFLKQQAQS